MYVCTYMERWIAVKCDGDRSSANSDIVYDKKDWISNIGLA